MDSEKLRAIEKRHAVAEDFDWLGQDYDAFAHFPQAQDDRGFLLGVVDELTKRLDIATIALSQINEDRDGAYRTLRDPYNSIKNVDAFLAGKFDDVCEHARNALRQLDVQE